jgi:hypothetical protein
MDEPVDVESVWPHTEMVLFLVDSDTCFGEPMGNIMEEVVDCEHVNGEGRHIDNDLSADTQRLPKASIERDKEIIPNSLILVHCDLVIGTKMEDYLNGTTIPKSSRIVAIIDDSEHSNPGQKLDMIQRPIERASSKEEIMDEARDYFRTICPECSGLSARSWVFRWCEGAYHRVEN